MCIQEVGENYDGFSTVFEAMNVALWNGREIQSVDGDSWEVGKCSKTWGSFIIGNTPIGLCPRGHTAYHKYLQTNQPPINLCDNSLCPFELYNFKNWVEGK